VPPSSAWTPPPSEGPPSAEQRTRGGRRGPHLIAHSRHVAGERLDPDAGRVLYCTVLHCTVLYCTALYRTVLHCTVLYCTVLHCTVLYCTALYCTVLHCTVL